MVASTSFYPQTKPYANSDYLIELDASNGKLLVRRLLESFDTQQPKVVKVADLVSSSSSYVVSPEGNLNAFDNQTGIHLWSVKIIEAKPSVTLVLGA